MSLPCAVPSRDLDPACGVRPVFKLSGTIRGPRVLSDPCFHVSMLGASLFAFLTGGLCLSCGYHVPSY